MLQNYTLSIRDLLSMSGSDACGAQAVIAITDGEKEVDRITITGKCQSPDGYHRSYTGKSGLTARLVSGVGSISFESHNPDRILDSVGMGLSEGWGSGKPA